MDRSGNTTCHCSPLYPNGDPNTECNSYNHHNQLNFYSMVSFHTNKLFDYRPGFPYNEPTKDCRTTGCVSGECVKQRGKYVCKQSESRNFIFIVYLVINFINHKHVQFLLYKSS